MLCGAGCWRGCLDANAAARGRIAQWPSRRRGAASSNRRNRHQAARGAKIRKSTSSFAARLHSRRPYPAVHPQGKKMDRDQACEVTDDNAGVRTTQVPTASLTHFLVKLVFAAPLSFFSAACVVQD